MTLRDELDRVIGLHLKGTAAGLGALTEGPQSLEGESAQNMDDAVRVRDAILNLGDVLESLTRSL